MYDLESVQEYLGLQSDDFKNFCLIYIRGIFNVFSI